MNDQDEYYINLVIDMLKKNPEASHRWELHNSLAGSILSVFHKGPRQYAEQLVGEANYRFKTGRYKK